MKTILRSSDMSCPSCVNNIEANLNKMEGVINAKVHFNTGRIEIEHDAEKVDQQKLMNAVRDSGYESEVSPF